MQNKTTQHNHRTLYAIEKAMRLLKTKEMIKDYIMIKIKKDKIMLPQSKIQIVFGHNNQDHCVM